MTTEKKTTKKKVATKKKAPAKKKVAAKKAPVKKKVVAKKTTTSRKMTKKTTSNKKSSKATMKSLGDNAKIIDEIVEMLSNAIEMIDTKVTEAQQVVDRIKANLPELDDPEDKERGEQILMSFTKNANTLSAMRVKMGRYREKLDILKDKKNNADQLAELISVIRSLVGTADQLSTTDDK